MELTLTTPAVLFPAMSVLILAYTNRFIAISKRVRALKEEHMQNPEESLYRQIATMHRRLGLIRNMQALGVGAFLGCVISMLMIVFSLPAVAMWLFCISLALLGSSLVIAGIEIYQSVRALDVHLDDLSHGMKSSSTK